MLSMSRGRRSLGRMPEREVDQRLALVFGGVFLGVGVEDGALRFAGLRQRHVVLRLRAIQQPGDEAVLAFVDRAMARLRRASRGRPLRPPSCRQGRCIGLPARDLALARLPRGHGHMQRLLHRLIDRLGGRPSSVPMPAAADGTEMGDVVDLVLVQADALHEIDLDFVGRREAANRSAPRPSHCCATARIGGMLSPGCE